MHIQVITAVPEREDALKIARTLVERRLAACTQIIGPVTSIYRWKEEVVEDEEWLCLIKTKRTLFEGVEEAVHEIHPYDIPEILAIPVEAGNSKYLEWLDRETENKDQSRETDSSKRGR